MRDAMSMEQAFSKSYLASAPSGRAFPNGSSAPERARVMPPEVPQMMLAYLGSLRPADRAAFSNVGRQLSRIQGHPISTKIEWRVAGDACAPKEAKAQQSGPFATLSGLFGSKDKSGETPILSFAIEVKALKVEPVRDSAFLVPTSYRRVN
jgi:hypothetical protein